MHSLSLYFSFPPSALSLSLFSIFDFLERKEEKKSFKNVSKSNALIKSQIT